MVTDYYHLSRKAAAEIRRRREKRRPLATEELDQIDDMTTDFLINQVRKLDEEGESFYATYLSKAFENWSTWIEGRKPRGRKIEYEYGGDLDARASNADWVDGDIVSYLGCPHPEAVRQLLEGIAEGKTIREVFGTGTSHWYQVQKPAVMAYLRRVYDDGDSGTVEEGDAGDRQSLQGRRVREDVASVAG